MIGNRNKHAIKEKFEEKIINIIIMSIFSSQLSLRPCTIHATVSSFNIDLISGPGNKNDHKPPLRHIICAKYYFN